MNLTMVNFHDLCFCFVVKLSKYCLISGLCMTDVCLTDDVKFEVRIDVKINSWSGSIEIGVTTNNPETGNLN